MTEDGSQSFYFFDIDDNLLFLPTKLYLWNAELGVERAISSGEFAHIRPHLGLKGEWATWAIAEGTYRDFRDLPEAPLERQQFIVDLEAALAGANAWRGPSWPLLVHAATKSRAIALVTARGHEPSTIEAGLALLAQRGLLARVPPIIGIYTVSNPGVLDLLGIKDPNMTIASIKKLAIKHAVETALSRYGAVPPHRFGMSDDDPDNVVLAISAMRDCKVAHPDKRFFVINTNHDEYVKLEIFPMAHPVTADQRGERLLADTTTSPSSSAPSAATSVVPTPLATNEPLKGGNASVYVTDLDRAITFYTDLLGLRLRLRMDSSWAEIDTGGGLTIGLHPARPPNTVAAGTRGAINIELAATRSLDAVVAELNARGVSFKGGIESWPAVRLATVLDPDGNEIILAEQLDTGRGA